MSDAASNGSRRTQVSERLLRAAISGLLGASGVACESSTPIGEPDPVGHDHGDHEMDASSECTIADAATGDGGSDAGVVASELDKEISTEDVQHTFAELTAMCEARDGYTQITASCSGTNTCQGFSYGDWGADAQLIEHSCAGVNGCNGLSCVTAAQEPAGGGLTGEEILALDEDYYIERAGKYGPKPCKNCHVPSEHDDTLDDDVYDYSKLRLLFWPGGTRNVDNWTDRNAAVQERMVALGVHGITEDGDAYATMAAYNKVFSKAEIARVVEHMRGFAAEDTVAVDINLEPGSPE